MQRFSSFITSQNPRPQGHPSGEVRQDGGTGPGPPAVCQTQGFPLKYSGTVQGLHRCLEPLIERDDLLDASMLEVVEEEPVTSPTPMEEAVLLG